MSCFKGKMNEYRNVSIDRFDGQNLNSTVYFLSHCHEDHTVGLKQPSFFERLQSSTDVFLYCSEVTKILLVENEKYKHLINYIKTIPVGETVPISVPHSDSCKSDIVKVTFLHAEHCPGSVMCLFEGDEGTALYTGDFRWEVGSAAKVSALHNGDSVKPIRSIYIDTTFCHGDTFHIPSRQECVEAVYSLVLGWLEKGQGHAIHFTPRSQYGHEYLLKEISERTNHKIHVSDAKYKIYEQIPNLKNVFTSVAEETPIHACLRNRFYKDDACEYVASKEVMTILPSTMYFTKKLSLTLKDIVEKTRGIYRACYSFHSSYREVRDVVTYLKPERVRPNVKPPQDNSIMQGTFMPTLFPRLQQMKTSTGQVQERLNQFLKDTRAPVIKDHVLKKFGSLRRKRYTKRRKVQVSLSSDSDDLVFGTPDKSQPKDEAVTPEKSGKGDVGDIVSEQKPPSLQNEIQTPVKSDGYESHSSYDGSHDDDEELSDTGLLQDNDEKRSGSYQTSSQSLLEALEADDADDPTEASQCRVCNMDDDEQVDGCAVIPSESLSDYDVDAIQEKLESSLSQTDTLAENLREDHKDIEETTPVSSPCEKLKMSQDSTGKEPGSTKHYAIQIGSSLENSIEIDANVSNNASLECEPVTGERDQKTTVYQSINQFDSDRNVSCKEMSGNYTSKRTLSVISVSDTDSEDERKAKFVKSMSDDDRDIDMVCDPEELEMYQRFKRTRSANDNGVIDLTQSESEEDEVKRFKTKEDVDSDSDATLPPSQNSITCMPSIKTLPGDGCVLTIDNSSDTEEND